MALKIEAFINGKAWGIPQQSSLNSRSKGRWLLPIFLQREQSGLRYFHTFFLVFNTEKSQKDKDCGTRILLIKHLAVYFSHSLLLCITGSYFLPFQKSHKNPILKSDSALFLPRALEAGELKWFALSSAKPCPTLSLKWVTATTSRQKPTIHSFSVKKSQPSAPDLRSSDPTLQLTPSPVAVAFHFMWISSKREKHEPTP